jgi:uncharacterized Zn finger protein
MTCPKCAGCLEGPEWDFTLQGKVLQVRCIQCGWRAFHPTSYVDYSEVTNKVLISNNQAVVINKRTEQISRVVDLSKYVFTE